jgi:hypothetical protein
MVSRINFLIAAGVVIAMALLLAGYYLIVTPVAAVAPRGAPYVLGVWVLISLGLAVSLLARLHGRLQASYAPTGGSPRRSLGFAGQALLYVGHIVVVAGIYRWISGNAGTELEAVVVAALIYAGGMAATLVDWRRSSL